MTEQPQPIHVRPPRPADQAYIASTWVSSLGMTDTPMTSSVRGHIVDSLLDKAGVKVLVACDAANQARILGWICWTPTPGANCCHFIYVRNQLRRNGIGNLLATAAGFTDGKPVVYTTVGPAAKWLLAKHVATALPAAEFLR